MPVAAVSVGGFAFAAATYAPTKPPTHLNLAKSASSASLNGNNSETTKPSVTVNGSTVPLDDNGQAHITTPSGATVQIDGKAPNVSATISSGKTANSVNDSVHYSVDSVNGGNGHSSSTTSVQVFGNTYSSTSNFSHTEITSNGTGQIQYNNQ